MPRWVGNRLEEAPTLAPRAAAPLEYPSRDWVPGKKAEDRWNAKVVAKAQSSRRPPTHHIVIERKATAQRLYAPTRATGYGSTDGLNYYSPSASGLSTTAPSPGSDTPDCTSAGAISAVDSAIWTRRLGAGLLTHTSSYTLNLDSRKTM
eukprot:SAG31_NODE_14750_length_789_cov_1.198551_1_plen_148_part_01